MFTVTRRLPAIVALLTLCISNLGVCAGWESTAEARMSCCANEATCPMHKSQSPHSGSTRVVSQAQADSCCASSERPTSPVASGVFALSSPTMLAALPNMIAAPAILPTTELWRAFVPLPPPPVPKHLLLSVLLV